ncbi:MAG: HIT domain-containing protein [Motiliproteus sp.]|nr:HIT domain-containing protein [Motiliproteus sp.]MCW9053861.1 HIT domain-containing protein [Motiliproteus sp.]
MDDRELVYDQAHDLDPSLHPFQLDPQLQQDTVLLGHLRLCDLLLMKDANYPWFVLVPRRSEVAEIFHLSEADQVELIRESSMLSTNLNDIYDATKMNVAALGNMVRQLHLHHVVRYDHDAAWPAPVWGKVAAKPYSDSEIDDIRSRVNGMLADEEGYQSV